MTIQTERLTLQPIGTAQLAEFHQFASDPDNTRMMLFMPMENEADSMQYLKERELQWQSDNRLIYEFALMADDILIGCASLDLLEDHSGELGAIIRKEYWGRGYASEANRALVRLARSLGVKRLIAHCDSENHGSRHALEKTGMQLVSITSGRKNRSSAELRQECLYEMYLEAEGSHEYQT